MRKKIFLKWTGTGILALILLAGFAKITDAQEEEVPVSSISAGVQVWGLNCARCHNAPPPNAFRDEEWKIITHHMKLRANLTDPEIAAVLAYFQSAN